MTQRTRFVITYPQDIAQTAEPKGPWRGRTSVVVGQMTLKGEVEVAIDLDAIASTLGARACRNKSGKCKAGFVTVKRIKTEVINRTMYVCCDKCGHPKPNRETLTPDAKPWTCQGCFLHHLINDPVT